MERLLQNKVGIVTGANQGLGFEIARAYLEAGCSVTICARNADLMEKAKAALEPSLGAGQQVIALAADVSNPRGLRGKPNW